MKHRGFIPSEPLVKWLHVGPREVYNLILISPIISITRHTVGKQITECEGPDCEYCLRRFPRRMRYFMLVLCDSERRLLELGERQADCLKFLHEAGCIGHEFTVHKNGPAINSPINAAPTLKRYDVEGIGFEELERLIDMTANWKPQTRTKVIATADGHFAPVRI